MAWPSARFKTASNGGSWVPADMNGVQDQYLRSAGLERDDLEQAITQQLGLTTTGSGHGGAAVRRGKSIIATEEARSNVAYGLLTTPDRVQSIVLPTDGLIVVGYQALWKNSVAGAASAAIFVGANQLKTQQETAPAVQAANMSVGNSTDRYVPLTTSALGLTTVNSSAAAYTSDVATGQILGLGQSSAVAYIFAAAGTYDVSVQFKATSGSVTAKERKLWVWTVGF